MRRISWLLAGTVLLVSFPFAQNRGEFGLNFRVDPQPRIGLTYHLSSRFAVRPYIGFSFGSSEAKSEIELIAPFGVQVGEREEDTTNLSFGMGLFYYFLKQSDFAAYTGVNFNYARETVDLSYSTPFINRPLPTMPPKLEFQRGEEESVGDIYQTSALLGMQYELSRHFSVFGEVGVGCTFSRHERENRVETLVKAHRWGIANSGIGIIFYF